MRRTPWLCSERPRIEGCVGGLPLGQGRVNAVADSLRDQTPVYGQCGQPMQHDTESVSWTVAFAKLSDVPCGICWSWNLGTSAVGWRACWHCWRS
jgi:hypothetical protein